jgi:hypothetical protein
MSNWWFPAVGRGRVAALRLIAYAFIPLDVLVTTGWVGRHGDVGNALYRPLLLDRLLHLPEPTPTVVALVRLALLLATAVALVSGFTRSDRAVRLSGIAAAALYLWWMLIAMSFGKVDHDRFGFLLLLFVLPTVGVARLGDRTPSPAAGWAVRMTQVGAVATYFLAGWAKVRIGGWGWVNGATLAWAVVRRGTWFSHWMLQSPWFLRGLQWLMLIGELASPLLFAVRRQRIRTAVVLGLYAFHVLTFAAISIIFLPHLVALAAFLPLEEWIRLRHLHPPQPPRREGEGDYRDGDRHDHRGADRDGGQPEMTVGGVGEERARVGPHRQAVGVAPGSRHEPFPQEDVGQSPHEGAPGAQADEHEDPRVGHHGDQR